MSERTDIIPLREVYDEESKKMVKIDPEQIRMASYIHQQVTVGVFITALSIRRIFDEKLYLALGCSSRQEYCDTMLPFGLRQAERYNKIATKFEDVMPQNLLDDPENATPGSHLDSEIFNDIGQLGYAKLYELTKIDDADFTEFKNSGTLQISDEQLTIEDIQTMTRREFTMKITEIKKQYSARISQLEEKNNLLESEKKTLGDHILENDTKVQAARAIETQFGATASRYENQIEDLDEAANLILRATNILMKMNPEVEFPVAYHEKVRESKRRIDWLAEGFETNFAKIIYAMQGEF